MTYRFLISKEVASFPDIFHDLLQKLSPNDFQQLKPQNNRVLYHLAVGLGGWGNVVRASKCDNIIVKRAPH